MTTTWRCAGFDIDLSSPVIMGIVNVTPDSFSDGGEHAAPHDAVAHGIQLLSEGAHILDVGGESTRPGAVPITSAQEIARVRPVISRLAEEDVPISVDTRHADVARACVERGAAIINDVSGFRDPAMVEVAASCEAGLVVMHMAGEPGTMQESPSYKDVVGEVADYLARQADTLLAAGVSADRICIDPGIGFGKTVEHNLELLRGIPALVALGYPVLVGASRKRFIGTITGQEIPRERLGGSVAAALAAVRGGARVLRVHDVAQTRQALAVETALTEEDTR